MQHVMGAMSDLTISSAVQCLRTEVSENIIKFVDKISWNGCNCLLCVAGCVEMIVCMPSLVGNRTLLC